MRARVALTPLVLVGCLVGCLSAPPPPPRPTAAIEPDEPDPDVRSLPEQPTAAPEPVIELPRGIPIVTDETRRAHAHAQSVILGSKSDMATELPSADADVHGRFAPAYEPSGTRPLAAFHDALADLRQGEDADGKVRVLVYGASGTAADRWTGYLRAYLQTRFGDGGPGFVPLGRHSKWARHQEYQIESSSDWIKHQTGRKTESEGGWYGLGGIALAANKTGAHALLSPAKSSSSSRAVASFELWYLEQPEGGTASVFVDGRPSTKFDSAAKRVRAAYEHIGLTAGAHSLELRTTNDLEVRTFGVVAESADPGVVVDALGVIGAHASAMLQWDEALWAEHLQRRDPDLVVLAFGTNEAYSESFGEERFRRQYGDALGRIRRAVPEASCLLMAPGDHGKAGEEALTDANLDAVRRIEIELADEHGCALWNAYEFMNGPGAMEAWVTADPPLAASDYVHTTSRGAVLIAMAVVDALVWGYDAKHQQVYSVTR